MLGIAGRLPLGCPMSAPTTTAVRSEPTSHVGLYAAAAILGCTRHRVMSFALHGRLPHEERGGHLYFLRSDVEALRDQLRTMRKRARR